MSETWIRQTLTAELLSAAHFGSGTGGGGIDALVARDRHGRPVIWASHVEGVLRDAMRRLRDDAAAKEFFGSAGGKRQRAIFTSLYTSSELPSHIWRATASTSFDNRAPKDDTLRAIEYVPRGMRFTGEVELPASQLETLQRLVQEVDALGAGRANGAGRVKLGLAAAASKPHPRSTPTGRLLLLLKNRDPLCITATATPDNLIPSLAFVPGRTLLGAMAAWLIAEDARAEATLLTSGQVSVSDALPLPQLPEKLEGLQVLPAPLSLQNEKPTGASGELPWWAQAGEPPKRLDGLSRSDDQDELKRPADDLFVYRQNEQAAWCTYQPARRVRLRNGRPNPQQDDASLFAIEQIVEETCFFAELHGSVDDLEELSAKLAPVLEGRRWLRVGRAGAPVEVAQFAFANHAPTPRTEGKALLVLASDLLVRDEKLRWRTALDEAALKELLDADVQLEDAMQDSVMVHGFNGTSRLWRMPAAAVRRGSVYRISGLGVAKLAARAANAQWLGERSHEGFGRFRIETELPGITKETNRAPAATAARPTATQQIADSADELAAARTLEWFNGSTELARVRKKDASGQTPPSLSQWFALINELEAGNRDALTNRLTPTTAGGKSWNHTKAKDVLHKLQALEQQQCALHARYFVRWLRAAMRQEARK